MSPVRTAMTRLLEQSGGVTLIPVDSPALVALVAGWLAQKENSQWLDFGDGQQDLTDDRPSATRSTASRVTACGLTFWPQSTAGAAMPDATAVVEARVAQILARALHLEIPSADLDLFETGAIDSLAFVEFLLHLEREFGIAVPLEE